MATGRRHPLHSASTIQLQRNVSAKAPLTDASFLGVKRWAVLNTQSGSLAPGAYRYRTAVGELRYAHCGADTAAAAVVPRIPTLLQTGGGAAGISFTSVRFAHTSTGPDPPQYSYGAPMRAAVELGAGSRNIRLRACAFTLLGGDAVSVGHDVADVDVSGCVFRDVGGRGFSTTLETTAAKQDASSIAIVDSVFDGCGHQFMDQPYCIFVSGSHNITVAHNDITDVPCGGIRVWGHFSSDSVAAASFDAGGPAVFTVSNNHVHNVGLGLLSDFGGIFVTTRPGGGHGADCAEAYGPDACNVLAVVSGNVVHGVRHHDHGGAGIYTDESSGRTNITRNLVFNNSGWGMHIHCGMRHRVENNIFAGNAAVAPAPFPQYMERDYSAEPFCNFHSHPHSAQDVQVVRNIFDQSVAPSVGVGRRVPLLNNSTLSKQDCGNSTSVLRNASLDFNLCSCWDQRGGSRGNINVSADSAAGASRDCISDFPGDVKTGRSLSAWQTWGRQDSHSVVGSPGFAADPATTLAVRRDFRVDPARSSAVRSIGFQPLVGLATVGPRPEELLLAVCENVGGDTGVWWEGCRVLD